MKKLSLLFLLFFCITVVQAQKPSISLNGNYRTKFEDLGIGVQGMIPLYKNLYFAPSISYYLENEYENNSEYSYSTVKSKSLNYALELNYAFNLEDSQSFVSPFIGIEGVSSWGSIIGTSSFGDGSNNFGGDFSDFSFFGNIGVAGKWFVDESFFINTQIKYSLASNTEDSHFVFTAGVGYAF